MIKARGNDKDGYPVYFLGISQGNLEAFREDRPMVVDLRELGGRGTVIIWTGAGKTEEEMQAEFTKHVGIHHIVDWKNPTRG